MRVSHVLSLLLAFAVAAVGAEGGAANFHAKAAAKHAKRSGAGGRRAMVAPKNAQPSAEMFLDAKTSKYSVNGSALPDVNFDIGESYAGSLSISSNPKDNNTLWFWFFPSTNPAADKEIVIWLNGGPGCSSLDGLLQENGPFLWQPGVYEPFQNSYSWVNLTNMIYIDQPVSTGFSTGTKVVNSEDDVAEDFMGFWKNFIDTFSMHGYKVYITGESYAGMYIPYIAGAMLDAKDTEYFNVKGIQINDPVISSFDLQIEMPSIPALLKYNNVLNVNESFVANLTSRWESCGYADIYNKFTTTFPPPCPIPDAAGFIKPECDVYDDMILAASLVNPCFNIYHITDFCPYLWDVLGFPSLAAGPNDYFNRSDVQAVIHAPPTDYSICKDGPNVFPNGDNSLPSAYGPLPSVIERTNNTIIGHGLLDFILLANGSLLAIQNMTWNGAQGFQRAPNATQNFFVPYHQSLDEIVYGTVLEETDTAGAGFQGVTHTERGLTFVTVALSGHMIPQYVPGAAYRQLEFLLGRIPSLETQGDFTTQTGNFSK